MVSKELEERRERQFIEDAKGGIDYNELDEFKELLIEVERELSKASRHRHGSENDPDCIGYYCCCDVCEMGSHDKDCSLIKVLDKVIELNKKLKE